MIISGLHWIFEGRRHYVGPVVGGGSVLVATSSNGLDQMMTNEEADQALSKKNDAFA